MDFDSLFSTYWAVATDAVLISAGVVFVLRLYIIELRLERGLPGYYSFYATTATNLPRMEIALDERWFLADDAEQNAHLAPAYQRLRRLGAVVQLLSLIIVALAIFLATGLVSAATATADMQVSAVVLSRCIVQYVNGSARASSSCSDSTAPSYAWTPPAITAARNLATAVAASAMAGTTATATAATISAQDAATVTLTY